MIPKATILGLAKDEALRETTVEKDYVLGWMLYGIARHPLLSRWVFKGGTCLKKCFFETYRFSEDLDFTVPTGEPLSAELVEAALRELCESVAAESGIGFPAERIDVEAYTNKQGTTSFNGKVGYTGPLRLAPQRIQRIKFDITQHELLVDAPDRRTVFHRYGDIPGEPFAVACYSVDEILAEKTRALYERQGRARDVYDVVHINRSYRNEVSPARAREILEAKFAFKQLPLPSVASVLARIDPDSLRANWDQQLRHQLPALPELDAFLPELTEALSWWMDPAAAPLRPSLPPITPQTGPVLPPRFPEAVPAGGWRPQVSTGESFLDRIRFAARNRLLVELDYHGALRRVEPYALREPGTGNRLLYGHEVSKRGSSVGHIKSYNLREIRGVTITQTAFSPRWRIEL